jgi:hypothetical protein
MLHRVEEIDEFKELIVLEFQSLNERRNAIPDPFGPIGDE